MAGKRAAGLPFAVTVPGGRAEGITVSPEGRGEVRVADIGKFAKPEQTVQIQLDWPRLLGVPADKAPAWIAAAPKAGTTAVVLKKGVETTRVLVLIYEKLEAGAPLAEPPVAAEVTAGLRRAGFDVQDSTGIVAKFGAERLAGLTDAQVKDAARSRADVVVIGTVTPRSSSVRAVDVSSGKIIFQTPSAAAADTGIAGRAALEALGKALAPGVEKALRAAVAP
jgi:hypothetical protein